jgi:probable phosphoglycerate mutase
MLQKIKFDKIYSSDLIRAMHTAELAIPGCEYETTPLLREVGMGSLELQPIAEVEADMLAKNTRELGYAMYGGESKAQLRQRAKDFLEMVQKQEYQTVAAFSHWGYIGAVLDQVFGITLPKMKMVCKNCTVCILEYEKETWKFHSWINPNDDIEESI